MNREIDRLISVMSVVAAAIFAIIVAILTDSWQYGIVAGGLALILCMIAHAISRLYMILYAARKTAVMKHMKTTAENLKAIEKAVSDIEEKSGHEE